jgi:hypothetical protein
MSEEFFLPLHAAIVSQDITLVSEILSSTAKDDLFEVINDHDASQYLQATDQSYN